MKLSILIDSYLNELKRLNYSPRTIETYKTGLAYLVDFLEPTSITEISSSDLKDFQRKLFKTELRMTSQARILTTVRMLFKYAAKEDFIFADPATSLDLPKEEKRLPRIILSEDEIDQLVNQSNQGYLGLRNRAILETFYATGMRVTELITLNIYSINQHDLTVRIKGKGRKDRIVPISGRALILVQKYINELRPTLAKRNKDADNTLFLGQLGKQMKRADLSNMLKMLAEKAALEKKVTPHVIRHSVATHLLRHGMDIRYIQELLGHEDLRTTQIYTKVENKDLRDMLDRYHPLN